MTPLPGGSVPEPRPTTLPDGDGPQLSLVEDEPRRYPSTIGGAFYLGVLLVMGIALAIVALGHWRGGVHVLGGDLVAAALLRALLPRRDLGMLAVRSRWFDVGALAVVGIALWFLATTIPAQG